MGITWSPAATDDFLSILKKVDELFGKMIAIKVSNKIQLHIGLLSSFPQTGVRDAIFFDSRQRCPLFNQYSQSYLLCNRAGGDLYYFDM